MLAVVCCCPGVQHMCACVRLCDLDHAVVAYLPGSQSRVVARVAGFPRIPAACATAGVRDDIAPHFSKMAPNFVIFASPHLSVLGAKHDSNQNKEVQITFSNHIFSPARYFTLAQ